MRYLDLHRHADAEPGTGMNDAARELTGQGRDIAARLHDDLPTLNPQPCYILCSSAIRTQQTRDIVRPALPAHTDIETASSLYNARISTIYELIKELPDEYQAAMLIGHNPGLSEIVNFLSATPLALKPADYVRLTIRTDRWANVMPGEGQVLCCFRPSMLQQE